MIQIMAKRQVFFSFEYRKDAWRASKVRNMGKVDNSSTFSDNDWEEVKWKSDTAIKKWIDAEMAMRSCIVVLVGATTSSSKWVKYEIEKAYELGKGIVGVRIDRLEDQNGKQTTAGSNPFYQIYTDNLTRLSSHVELYEPQHLMSANAYNDIKDNLERLIEKAIDKAGTY